MATDKLVSKIATLPLRAGDEIVVFIPSKDRAGSPIDQGFWKNRALRLFGRIFRGANAVPADGSYRTDSGKVMVEQVVLVSSAVQLAVVEAKANVIEAFLRRLCEEGNQEEAGLLVNRHYIGVRGVEA